MTLIRPKPSKIKIHRVSLSDVKPLMALIMQLGYLISEESLTARIALYQESNHDFAWVATIDDLIIGYIAIHTYDLFHCTDRCARIISIVVKDTHRRQGIGKKLLKFVEKEAIKQNCSQLELTSNVKRKSYGVIEFYQQFGFNNEGDFESVYLRKLLKMKEGPFI